MSCHQAWRGAAAESRCGVTVQAYLVLVLPRHAEVLEHQDEHEQVVDAEALLQDVTREVLGALRAALRVSTALTSAAPWYQWHSLR